MHKTVPKEIRENIARTKGYLRRNEVPRALETLSLALRQSAGLQMLRQARFELDISLEDALAEVSRHPDMQPILDPQNTGTPKALPYQKNKEGVLATVLENLAKMLQDAAKQQLQEQINAAASRKNELIATGIDRIKAGEFARGRAFLKRAAAEYGDEEGLYLSIGNTLASLEQYTDAAEILEKAIEATPKEPTAYTLAIDSYCALGEYAKAEAVYMKILRQFGGHARTYGKMAQLYMLWQKRSKAEDMAIRALQTDPQQAEALEVMQRIERR